MSANLKLLMAARPGLDTLPKITAKTAGRLSNGKLDRIRRAAVATDIDSVEQLAQAFGLEPWQLLHEALDSTQLTDEPAVTHTDDAQRKKWPFSGIDPEKIGRLPAQDAADLESAWLRIARNLEIDIEVGRSTERRRG
jgi:hypothetical protein